jgi:hypothetical protein
MTRRSRPVATRRRRTRRRIWRAWAVQFKQEAKPAIVYLHKPRGAYLVEKYPDVWHLVPCKVIVETRRG